MKKVWIFVVLLSLLLGACSGGKNTATTTENNTEAAAAVPAAESTGTQGAPGNGELPEIAKILLGSFLLEDTDYAITAEQAASLLPMWKGLNALQDSDTITNAELEGLYAQIAATMTEDQMAQIEMLDVSFDSMNTIMESLGLGGRGQGGPGGDMGDLTEEQIATMQAEREANGDQGFPGGGPGGGGQPGGDAGMMAGGPGGAGGDAGMMAMGAATDSEGNVLPEQAGDPSLRMMSRLFEPLIELLQSKIS